MPARTLTTTFRLLYMVLAVWSSAEATAGDSPAGAVDLQRLTSPIVIQGDDDTGYRDPAVVYHEGMFYLYMTRSTIDTDGLIYNQTAWSKSRDLLHWTEPKPFTPKDRSKNYSSPGNVIRDGPDFVLCLQTYPTPKTPRPCTEPAPHAGSCSTEITQLGCGRCAAETWNTGASLN